MLTKERYFALMYGISAPSNWALRILSNGQIPSTPIANVSCSSPSLVSR